MIPRLPDAVLKKALPHLVNPATLPSGQKVRRVRLVVPDPRSSTYAPSIRMHLSDLSPDPGSVRANDVYLSAGTPDAAIEELRQTVQETMGAPAARDLRVGLLSNARREYASRQRHRAKRSYERLHACPRTLPATIVRNDENRL